MNPVQANRIEPATPRLRSRAVSGFTLVELLVVLFLLLILAAVALPTIRNVLLDQKNARAARSIASFIDIARSRAIAEGREVGVYLERLSEDLTSGAPSNPEGAASTIRLRQMTGVPAYSGESSDAVAVLGGSGGLIQWASFDPVDNALLQYSMNVLTNADPTDDLRAPIRPLVDRLELPGGKIVIINSIESYNHDSDALTPDHILVRFDLRNPQQIESGPAQEFPSGIRRLTVGQRVKYRIHRSAVMSNTSPLPLPRGIAIDLNLSGIGLGGMQFASSVRAFPPTVPSVRPIIINFGPDGRVSRVIQADGSYVVPHSQIYLCLGDLAGIRPDDLFAATGRDRSNLTRPKTSWIAVNNQTGRVSVAPNAPIMTTVGVSTLPFDQVLQAALTEARLLASLSDSKEAN